MTLIATGDNLRNKAMLGLQAMSQEEAEREAIRQQMLQQEKAQRAQLAGTALGIGGAYVQREYGGAIADKISGLFSTPQAPALTGDAVMSGGNLLVNQSPALAPAAGSPMTAGQALTAASNPSAVGALASPAGTTAGVLGQSGTVAGGTAGAVAAPTGALATGGGVVGGAQTAGAATQAGAAAAATPSAGTMTLAKLAPPLAIGLGAFFLLNQLFDF